VNPCTLGEIGCEGGCGDVRGINLCEEAVGVGSVEPFITRGLIT
jgi:hypothetical protein